MLRFLTAGESHGPELTVVLEGLPAGIPVDKAIIDADLARRQEGEGSGGRMAIEKDAVRITGGVMAGLTTGAPVAMVIANKDFASWVDRDITPMTVPRPGHVDLNAAVKYGYQDLRLGLERSSARETAARVGMAALCRTFLNLFGIRVAAYVVSIGTVKAANLHGTEYQDLFARAESSPVRCPDPAASEVMVEAIRKAREAGDTLGGICECVALHVPPGLGSHVHWDRRLSSRLMAALGSIPAIKGVQFGNAFTDVELPGTQFHDAIARDDATGLVRIGNHSGGLEGGITTGETLVMQIAMKPIGTTLKGIPSVDLATGQPSRTVYERSDICAVPRACVVAEAMMLFVLADALIEKLGGDSIDEMLPRFRQLRRARMEDVQMANVPWRFGFDRT
jgi:chorismate synthase